MVQNKISYFHFLLTQTLIKLFEPYKLYKPMFFTFFQSI